jgi:succinate dehydrogenase/fumarate reductase cytochrome b subunit
MSSRQTVLRSLHDLGLAAWFGGTLMGTVGLNGGTAKAKDPTERLRLSSIGWGRWAPVELAAIVTHGIGGIGLIVGNKGRLAAQGEARSNTLVKLGFTALAGTATLYSGILGTRIAKHANEGAQGVTEPGASTSSELAAVQRQQKVLQWTLPLLTGVLVVLAAQQGEQQRPVAGFFQRSYSALRGGK